MSGLPPAPPASVRIAWLAEHPQVVAELAAIHHAEWGTLMPDWSEADAARELEDHATRRAFPTTWVALDDADAVIGSVSLVAEDAAQFADLSPWLCSLWVTPDWRGQGVAQALIGRLLFAARRWQLPPVWLFTAGSTALYTRMGFVEMEQRLLHGQAVRLLRAQAA